ncbi:MAG TPA: hypothetical protein DCS97_12490, partial [Planctomycetes bacterium]|nr:hypothetical protein [Planctomycetota bacterium]
LDAAWLTLDPAGRLAQLGPAPAAEPPPAATLNSMSTVVAASELPPALTAPVNDPTLPPSAVELSPVVALPGFWTTDQEAGAKRMLGLFSGSITRAAAGYEDEPGLDTSRQRPEWHGRPLPQTRFL